MVNFIDLLEYREITLKNDTEPAIIAFRNRVVALCKAEVTMEDAVKGDNESNPRSNATALNHQNNQVSH